MAETDPENQTPGNTPAPQPESPVSPAIPATPKKKRRLLLKIGGGVVVGLILLVLAAPTLISTRPGLSIILGVVNSRLNGHVEVSSLSLGWLTGAKVQGVRVFDRSKAQIAQLDRLSIPLPLWKAALGKLDLGDVFIEGLYCDAIIDQQDQLNFARLLNSTSAPAGTGASAAESTDHKPSKFPAFSGNFKLVNCQATFSAPGAPAIYLTKIYGEINIPSINAPITDSLSLHIRSGDHPEGTIKLAGTASAIKDNLLDLNTSEIHQTLDMNQLDLQSAKAFIAKSAGIETLDGAVNLHLAADLSAGKNATVDASITGQKPIAFGGPVVNGDILRTSQFIAAVPHLTGNFPNGVSDWKSARFKVGAADGSPPIEFKLDHGQVTARADLVPQAVLNLIVRRPAGSDGKLLVNSNVDIAKIIPQLQHTVAGAAGLLVDSGAFTESLTLNMSPDKSSFTAAADSTPIVGTRTQGKTRVPFKIDQAHVSISSEYLGADDLREINLLIHSKFANGEFKGPSLASLNGTFTANLSDLHAQLAQILPDTNVQFGGNLVLKIGADGQLDQPPYKSKLMAHMTGNGLQYSDQQHAVNEPSLLMDLSADLQRSSTRTLESVKNLTLSLAVGDGSTKTIDLLADAPNIMLGDNPAAQLHLTHLTADLGRLQKELANVPAGTSGVVVDRGTLSLSGLLNCSGSNINTDGLTLAIKDLFVARQLANGQHVTAMAGEAVDLFAAGTAEVTPDGFKLRLKGLDIGDVAKIISLQKVGEGDFVLDKSAGGTTGAGKLSLAVELGSVKEIQKKLTQDQPDTVPGELQGGKITAAVTLSQKDKTSTGIIASVDVANLVVAGDSSATPALPPLQVSPFTVGVTGDVSQAASAMVVSVDDLTTKNVAFVRGKYHYAAKDSHIKLTASSEGVITRITQLSGDLFGIAAVSTPAPITINGSAVNGTVKLTGSLADLTAFYSAYKGVPPAEYPYRGDLTATETIATLQNITSLKGGLQIAKLQTFDGSKVTFNEDLMVIDNDLALTDDGKDQSVAIKHLGIDMQSSGAMKVVLDNGTILHLQSTRDMQLHPMIHYDLAKLYPAIQPMLGDDYKTLKITGVFDKQFNITGSYPANLPSTEAIKTLHSDGDLAVSSFDYDGLSLQNFIVPFDLEKGLLVTIYANKPAGQNTAAPAIANGGPLDLSNITLDLTQDPPRLSIPANKALISKLTVNPLFAKSYLANILDNPVFAGAQTATGLFYLTVKDCTQLPLGDLVNLPIAANTGKADLTFSLTDLNISLGGIAGLGSALKQDSFTANVKDATVSVARGMSTQHISFVSGDYSLNFDGKVRLKDKAFVPLELSIGPLKSLLSRTGLTHDPNIIKSLPDRAVLPVEGTMNHANIRWDKAIGKILADAAGKAAVNQGLGGLLNKFKK